MLTALQEGYTKLCCFLCEWNNRGEGQALPCKAIATVRKSDSRSEECSASIFGRQDEYILYIKHGLIKICMKAMNKEGIFVGPQVQQLFQDLDFENKIHAVDRRAWDTCENE
jgi:hypothetical protein